MPATFEAERLMVCEVVTPGGNWSSYPPHKHDEELMDETELEEIYYFEVGSSPTGQDGFAFQRVYGTAQRPIDLLAEVRQGDVVLIPHGYHGPSMAAPGYDLYYLNVMAGPGERAWLASDDPAHAWVRGTWADQPVDPRLGSARWATPGWATTAMEAHNEHRPAHRGPGDGALSGPTAQRARWAAAPPGRRLLRDIWPRERRRPGRSTIGSRTRYPRCARLPPSS